jgi:hypothetical protein
MLMAGRLRACCAIVDGEKERRGTKRFALFALPGPSPSTTGASVSFFRRDHRMLTPPCVSSDASAARRTRLMG